MQQDGTTSISNPADVCSACGHGHTMIVSRWVSGSCDAHVHAQVQHLLPMMGTSTVCCVKFQTPQ